MVESVTDLGLDWPTIPEFFAGRCVFVTGATGFMGKVLIEKLLYSCPEIETIYLLLRPKKGRAVEERLEELKNNLVFKRLKRTRPEALIGTQLQAVAGDVGLPGLGLSKEDRDMLCSKVSLFFHSAATVRFDDPLRKAVHLNTRGTWEAIKIAQDMKQLLVFVYVSTTYCNTTRFEIDETVYPAALNWRSVLKILDEFDDDTLDIVTPKLLQGLPNTYAFSKGLAEDCIYEHRKTVPAIIYRPSVVCSSMLEPMPGWLDNLNGPAGLLIACGKGVVHSVLCNRDKVMDFSPVDVAIKGMIVAAWKNAVEKNKSILATEAGAAQKSVMVVEKDDGRRPDCPPVYNCATSSIRPVTIGTVTQMAIDLACEVPLNDCLWYPFGMITTNRFVHYTVVFCMQVFPAIVLDAMLRFKGQEPRVLMTQRRIYLATHAIEYYLNNEWTFPNQNFLSLQDYTRPEDKVVFGSQVWEDDERVYFKECMYGARKYLLNEPKSTFPAAKKHMLRMYWLDKVVRGVAMVSFVYVLTYVMNLGSTPSEQHVEQAP